MSFVRVITLAQFQEEYRAQAELPEDIVWICPVCKSLQSGRDMMVARKARSFEELKGRIGYACIGRYTGKGPASPESIRAGKGCNWSLGGPLQRHELAIKTPDGKEHPHFELASQEVADAYRAGR